MKAEACAREEAVAGILSGACSFLVMVPGHPDHGPFYLVSGLLNVIQACPWRLPTSLPSLYLRMLCLFNTYGQQELPYRVTGIDSNDVLYAAEAEYLQALGQLSSKTLSGARARHRIAGTILAKRPLAPTSGPRPLPRPRRVATSASSSPRLQSCSAHSRCWARRARPRRSARRRRLRCSCAT